MVDNSSFNNGVCHLEEAEVNKAEISGNQERAANSMLNSLNALANLLTEKDGAPIGEVNDWLADMYGLHRLLYGNPRDILYTDARGAGAENGRGRP